MSDFETILPKLMGATFSHIDGDIRLFWEDENETTEECVASNVKPMLVFIKGAGDHVFIDLRDADGVLGGLCFAFRDSVRAMDLASRLKPSFMITGENSTRLIYLTLPDDRSEDLLHDLMEAHDDDAYVDHAFPLPYGDFDLSNHDLPLIEKGNDLPIFTIEELEAALFDDDPGGGLSAESIHSDTAFADEPVERRNDAEVYGTIPEEILKTQVRVAVGQSQEEKKWTVSPEADFELFFDKYLTNHTIGKKNGPCFVTGALVEKTRNKNAVSSLYMLALDVDSGASLNETFSTIKRMGLFTVAYTTHSHGTSTITIKQDAFYKWAEMSGREPDFTTERVKEFLTEKTAYVEDVIAQSEYVETIHDTAGMQLIVNTRPIDKFRLIFLLDKPYVIAEQKMAQRDAILQWERLVMGMGAKLGIVVDRAARDPSRLFFYPRHAKGDKNFRILVNGSGKKLDWTKVEQIDPKSIGNRTTSNDPFESAAHVMGARARGRPTSPSGLDLKTWASERGDGFLIGDVLKDHADDRLRGEVTTGKYTCECPFDEEHTDSGNPDDKGCYVEDAGGAVEQFRFHCSHNSCTGRDRLDMLEKAMIDGWFTDEVLTDKRYDCIDRPETVETVDEETGEVSEEKPKQSTEAVARAQKLISGASASTDSETISSIMTLLVEVTDFDRTRLIGDLAKKVGVSAAALGKLYRDTAAASTGTIDDGIYDPDQIATSAKKKFKSLRGEKKPIVVISEERQVDSTKHMLKKLAEVNKVNQHYYRYGGNKVRVERAEDGSFQIDNIDMTIIQNSAMHYLRVIKMTDSNAFSDILAPEWAAKQCANDNDLHLHNLVTFTTMPYFNKDKELIMRPGYDPLSQKILHMPKSIAEVFEKNPDIVNTQPTINDVDDALNELLGTVFADFPFNDGPDAPKEFHGRSSRAHLLCMMLHPIVRDLIDGPTPLYIVNKPMAGTGASLLVSTAMTIATGKTPATEAMPDNEEELRKKVTSLYLAGKESVFLDNVNIRLDSGIFANLATAEVWSDRMLGQSKVTEVPNRLQAIFGGNNIEASEENRRRMINIYMQLQDDPTLYEREFVVPDLKQYVREFQIDLFLCLLTIVQYWINQGAPLWEGKTMPSFESYCQVMGGILETCEIEGFLENKSMTSNQFSPDRMAWNRFMMIMVKKFSFNNFVTMSDIANHYLQLEGAPTLRINGGGVVYPNMSEDKLFGALQRILDKQLNQVFHITYNEEDIKVSFSRKIDQKTSTVLYGIEEIKDEAEAA